MQDRTTQYAADVLAGKIIAGDLVKLACKRHLDDIEKSKAAPYKYYFDVEQAERIIEFAETLTIAEGEEEEQVECYAFQCFILGNLNGWRTKTGGHRRFRTSYVQLGRQKLLTDEEAFNEGKYYKLNEKVLLRTDSKTQMEIFATGVQNGIQKVNECRRKLDLMDAEGGDQLIVNGNYIPITEVGKQYEKAGNVQQQSVLPIQPETDQKTQKDPEEGDQADTTGTEPDEKESQEGGENDEE